jgi:hypothetical protein
MNTYILQNTNKNPAMKIVNLKMVYVDSRAEEENITLKSG